MSGPRPHGVALALFLGAVLLQVGCSDSVNLITPENQLEVTSATDQFQLQLSALDEVTDTRSYDWENTGPSATIDISQAITSGSAILTIRDAAGDVVYQEDIASDSDGNTPEGVPGVWRIELVLTNTTGTFNFRLQKTT